MEILIPFVTASIIDKGIQAGDMSKVLMYGGLMLVLAFISLFAGIQAGKYAALASTGFACNLREGIYSNIQNFAFSNIDKYSTAGLITRMTTDVTNVQNAYQMILRIAVRAPLMMICSMVMCFIINPTLSFIFLGALILLGFVLFFIIYKVTPIFTEGFAKYDDLNASVQENVTGIRVVKAFVREDHENKKFSKAAGNLYKIFVKAESWLAFNNPIMMFVIYGSIIALSWFAAHFITDGTMTTGNLTSMFCYVMSMMMSLMMLSMIFVMVSMSAASARRIAEVLNEKAPEHIEVSFPVKFGVIADIENMQTLLFNFFNKINEEKKITGSDFYIAVPTDVTEVEKRAFYELVVDSKVKAKNVYVVDKPVADAIGAGLDVTKSKGIMVVNIGAETTEISVLSLGGIVISKAVKIGGNKLDDCIISNVRKAYNLVIGSKTAENLKKELGSAVPVSESFAPGFGRNVLSGLPVSVDISSDVIYQAIIDALHSIMDAIKVILERTPPELAADIIKDGVYFTGGTAQINNLEKFIKEETNLNVNIVEHPAESVVRGLMGVVSNPDFAKVAYTPTEKNFD